MREVAELGDRSICTAISQTSAVPIAKFYESAKGSMRDYAEPILCKDDLIGLETRVRFSEIRMRVRSAVMLAVVIALVAGGAAEAAPAVSACTLFSKNELKPFIKNRFFDQVPGDEERVGNGSTCTYAGAVIQIDPFPFSVVQSTWTKDKGNFEQIAGLGDAAYLYRNTRADAAEIAVRIGQRVFTAQVDLDQGEPMDAARTRAIGIARAAVAKLR